jgi:hypothetical protein
MNSDPSKRISAITVTLAAAVFALSVVFVYVMLKVPEASGPSGELYLASFAILFILLNAASLIIVRRALKRIKEGSRCVSCGEPLDPLLPACPKCRSIQPGSDLYLRPKDKGPRTVRPKV